jgi:predicted RNase H-related nuclease YkuK (DUF458 family)
MTPTPTRPEPTTPELLRLCDEMLSEVAYPIIIGLDADQHRKATDIVEANRTLARALKHRLATGARGAVVEEIAKRHEATEAGHKLYAEGGRAVQAVSPQVHDDRGVLLALIGKQP